MFAPLNNPAGGCSPILLMRRRRIVFDGDSAGQHEIYYCYRNSCNYKISAGRLFHSTITHIPRPGSHPDRVGDPFR
jgi:hypothetical protein